MTHTIVKPISLTPIHTKLVISQFGVELQYRSINRASWSWSFKCHWM